MFDASCDDSNLLYNILSNQSESTVDLKEIDKIEPTESEAGLFSGGINSTHCLGVTARNDSSSSIINTAAASSLAAISESSLEPVAGPYSMDHDLYDVTSKKMMYIHSTVNATGNAVSFEEMDVSSTFVSRHEKASKDTLSEVIKTYHNLTYVV